MNLVTIPRGTAMLEEIGEQPDVLARILHSRKQIDEVASRIRNMNIQMVWFAARGTSDNAATYARYLVETQWGLPAGLMAPSAWSVYGGTPRLDGALVVVVSQSGGSPDLELVTRRAREAGALVLAVTNNSDSPVARAADLHLDVMAGPERAVAATKSYTAQLFTLYLLVNAVAGDVSFQGDELIETANSVVSRKNQWLEVADRYSDISRLLVTARGYHYASALEVALKIMETSYIDAHAFSGADLLHGPMAMVDVDTPVLAIIPDGLSANSMKPLLSRLSETTNRLIVAGGLIGEGIRGSHVDLRHKLNESLSPIIDIIALQYFAWKMAIDRGHDPDHPRGLSKVTQTL